MSICDCIGLQPLTAPETVSTMQRWRMLGGFAAYATNGKLHLTTVMAPTLNMLAQRMVLAGYGQRLARGIDLNAAGLALWQQANP